MTESSTNDIDPWIYSVRWRQKGSGEETASFFRSRDLAYACFSTIQEVVDPSATLTPVDLSSLREETYHVLGEAFQLSIMQAKERLEMAADEGSRAILPWNRRAWRDIFERGRIEFEDSINAFAVAKAFAKFLHGLQWKSVLPDE